MKTLLILAPLAAALAGCAYYSTPPAVAVTPAVTAPSTVVAVPAQPATVIVPSR